MIAVVDYKMINLGSVMNMLRHVGASNIQVVQKPEELLKADKVILPGVGSFDSAMVNLQQMNLIEALKKKATQDQVPFLGICLGMQILTDSSEEGTNSGLGLISGETKKFIFNEPTSLKVPHMGWNKVRVKNNTKLFDSSNNEERFYFVHSYYVKCKNDHNVMTTTQYGQEFTSSVVNGNVYGVQFHPEKSHTFGKEFFRRFLKI